MKSEIKKSKSQYEKFGVDELGFMQTVESKILSSVAKGEIDLNLLAQEELSNRGLNSQGEWVGFEKANEIFLKQDQSKDNACRNIIDAAKATLKLWNTGCMHDETDEVMMTYKNLEYSINELRKFLRRN